MIAGSLIGDGQHSIRSSLALACRIWRRAVTLLWAIVILSLVWRCAAAEQVRVVIEDDAPDHVHTPGSPFSVKLTIDHGGQAAVSYHWHDFRGRRLTDPVRLPPGRVTVIEAPDGVSGYLGLRLTSENGSLVLPNRQPGEAREYGFARLPPPATARPQVDYRSRFGVVHADLEDPFLGGWIKTLTWNTTSPDWWGYEMEKRRASGLLELPIVVGSEWKTADTRRVTRAQLARLESRVREYFAADPQTRYWETGIEENLRHRYQTDFYWANLAAKIRVVRQAADEVNPEIKLIYQVAELRLDDVRRFLRSKAAGYFDVLSLHPYAWPDFPDPEEWLSSYLGEVNGLLKEMRLELPLWFTEAGVPHRGNHPFGFFGYPDKGVEIAGKSPYEVVNYLVKLHVVAFHLGVDKVFWYNYRDRKPGREYAENHFGLRDYWDYPKPAYPAYINLKNQLNGMRVGRAWKSGDIRLYEFIGREARVLVAWTYPAATREIPISELLTDTGPADVIAVVDPVGTPVPYRDSLLRISAEPAYIQLRLAATSAGIAN